MSILHPKGPKAGAIRTSSIIVIITTAILVRIMTMIQMLIMAIITRTMFIITRRKTGNHGKFFRLL